MPNLARVKVTEARKITQDPAEIAALTGLMLKTVKSILKHDYHNRFKGTLADTNGNLYQVFNVPQFASEYKVANSAINRLLNDPFWFVLNGFYNHDRYPVIDSELEIVEPLLCPYLSVKRCKNVPYSAIAEKSGLSFMKVRFYYAYLCHIFREKSKRLTA